jgi:pullulanase
MKKILLGIFIFLFNGVIMNTNSQTLKVNYKRLENDYENWRLWVWNKTDSRPGFDVYPSTISDFGLVFLIDLEKNNLYGKEIGLLPKYKEWENKEPFDRIFKHNGEKEVFIIEGDTNVYRSLKEIEISTQVIAAYYDDNNLIRITLNRRVAPSFISENFYLIDTQTGDKKELQKINDEKSKNIFFLKLKNST